MYVASKINHLKLSIREYTSFNYCSFLSVSALGVDSATSCTSSLSLGMSSKCMLRDSLQMHLPYSEKFFAGANFHGIACQPFRRKFHGFNLNFASPSAKFCTMQKFSAIQYAPIRVVSHPHPPHPTCTVEGCGLPD